MKNKSLLFVAAMLASFACSDDDTQYAVAPELESYMNTFVAEAQERGVTIPKNNLIAEVSSKSQSIANGTTSGDQKYLHVNQSIFQAGPSSILEYNIYNALGELFVNKKVYPAVYEREAFFNDLLTN